MIKVQDWVATIPDEDKHIAYVGEDNSEIRQFLLCGDGWKRFREWQFHLDMAFDMESVTSRDGRQVVQTTRNYQETVKEEGKVVDEVTSKETYTVHSEETTNQNQYDVASLEKEVAEDGITLTWKVLRQQTSLPGKLWATLRAVKPDGTAIKKSAIMVFEVDAAIDAVPATRPTRSEFEEMELRIDALCEEALSRSDEAHRYSTMAYQSAATAAESATRLEALVEETQVHCAAAERIADAAEEARREARIAANAAADCVTQTAENVQACLDANARAVKAEERCLTYLQGCEVYEQTWADNVQSLNNLTYRRVNVRDCGAVGDGVADDRQAIITAFERAKTMLPCEVYFPAGVYGINNGMYITLPNGSGGLRVCGAGRDVTTIRYMNFDPTYSGNNYYAFRFQPANTPTCEQEYLHDITVTGLTVHDPDPDAHASHTAKGTAVTASGAEETHGFDFQYVKRLAVTDCTMLSLGDECIDIYGCEDVIVANNHLENCPAAGPGGGAIAVCDGSKGVVVTANTINGTGADYVLTAEDLGSEDGLWLSAGVEMSGAVELPDGTVIGRYTKLTEDTHIPVGTKILKNNYGIVVESLSTPVEDVIITGNTVRNIHGIGIKMYAVTAPASVDKVVVSNNVIDVCNNGIELSGACPKTNIKVHNNIVTRCSEHGMFGDAVNDITCCGNTFRDVGMGVSAYQHCGASHQLYMQNHFENVAGQAVMCGGVTVIKDCSFKGVGTTDTPPATLPNGAIEKSTLVAGTLTVSGCALKDIRLSGVKSGIQNVDYIEHTDIELVSKSGSVNAGGDAIKGTSTKRVIGGRMGGRIAVSTNHAIVQGVTVTSTNIGDHAIKVSGKGVTVTDCHIQVNKVSTKGAIGETDGSDYNLFANNVVNRAIVTVGANTLAVNNITVDLSA